MGVSHTVSVWLRRKLMGEAFMKFLSKWKKIALSACVSCAVAFSALAVAFLASNAKGNVIASGETASNVTVDFSSSTALADFTTANSDGKVGTITDGRYYPNAWAQNYFKLPIATNETRHVSLDFYLPTPEEAGASYSQLWMGLITDPADINTAGKSVSMQMSTSFNVTYAYKNAQKQGTYIGQFAKMTFGEEHHLEMFIENGVITYAIDGNTIRFAEGFSTVDAPSNGTDDNAYLFFEFSNKFGYIDNIKISDCSALDFSSNLVASKYINVLSGGTKCSFAYLRSSPPC